MNQGIHAAPHARCLARRARRGRERGAAVFVVVLLITMLLGIGIFAARSASLSTATSGHERQMTQAQYLAEYGVLLSYAELNTKALKDWRKQAFAPQSTCFGQDSLKLRRCVKYCSFKGAQETLGREGQAPLDLLGLGSTQIEGSFCVELTDWTPTPIPQPGSGQTLTSYSVTATSVAVVRGTAPDPLGWSSSTQMSRAYITTGAIP
jgi:hypothetical protein